jgi:hypothetical protein
LALFGGWVVDYASGMRFHVLGPLEVEADDGPVALGGPKERLLLALLLTRPNQVVPVEALVQGLWGERPPPTAAKTLQSHVKRLRRVLSPAVPAAPPARSWSPASRATCCEWRPGRWTRRGLRS